MDEPVTRVRVEDIEEALAQVAEIKAARVVSSPDGVIQEVHVLALPTKAPKQLVRDIESAIMARFGIPIDHKKISIAQLGHEVVPSNGSAPTSIRPKIATISSSVTGVTATVNVTLEIDGSQYVGMASGPNSQTGRQRLVAEAALDALSQHGDGSYTFALEDVVVLQLGKERVAVACVTLVSTLGEQSFAGSALVRQNENDSIVRATLDAFNRRMGFLTT